jgi:hypothetical protein
MNKLECNKAGHNMMCSGYLKIRYYFEMGVIPYPKCAKRKGQRAKIH